MPPKQALIERSDCPTIPMGVGEIRYSAARGDRAGLRRELFDCTNANDRGIPLDVAATST